LPAGVRLTRPRGPSGAGKSALRDRSDLWVTLWVRCSGKGAFRASCHYRSRSYIPVCPGRYHCAAIWGAAPGDAPRSPACLRADLRRTSSVADCHRSRSGI
jgi:hypothetical protein